MRTPLILIAASASAALLGVTACGSSAKTATPGSAFCNSAQNLVQSFANLGGASGDFSQAKNALSGAASVADQMDDNAPSDIANDMHTVRQAFDGLASGLQSASNSDAFSSISSSVSAAHTDLDAAANRVATYVQAHCGVDLNGTGSSSSTQTIPSGGTGSGPGTESESASSSST